MVPTERMAPRLPLVITASFTDAMKRTMGLAWRTSRFLCAQFFIFMRHPEVRPGSVLGCNQGPCETLLLAPIGFALARVPIPLAPGHPRDPSSRKRGRAPAGGLVQPGSPAKWSCRPWRLECCGTRRPSRERFLRRRPGEHAHSTGNGWEAGRGSRLPRLFLIARKVRGVAKRRRRWLRREAFGMWIPGRKPLPL